MCALMPVIISEFVSSLKEGFDRDKNMSQAIIEPGDYHNRCMSKNDVNTYSVRGTGEDAEVGGSVRLDFALSSSGRDTWSSEAATGNL